MNAGQSDGGGQGRGEGCRAGDEYAKAGGGDGEGDEEVSKGRAAQAHEGAVAEELGEEGEGESA